MDNNLPVYGNILTFNALPDIQRCLDSVSGITDKILIVDSFSTDGTWEWLNNVKEVYNLELYQNKFISFRDQRQFLLNKTPVDSWIVALDADEAFNCMGSLNLRSVLQTIPLEEINKQSELAVVDINLPFVNLTQDVRHRVERVNILGCRVFLYKDNVRWKNTSHSFPHLKTLPDEQNSYCHYDAPAEIAIKHYAFLNPTKMAERKVRKEQEKDRSEVDNNFYYKDKHKVLPLERVLW